MGSVRMSILKNRSFCSANRGQVRRHKRFALGQLPDLSGPRVCPRDTLLTFGGCDHEVRVYAPDGGVHWSLPVGE